MHVSVAKGAGSGLRGKGGVERVRCRKSNHRASEERQNGDITKAKAAQPIVIAQRLRPSGAQGRTRTDMPRGGGF